MSSTEGRASTTPNRRFDCGMRTRPSSGLVMNHVPPPTRKTRDIRMPAVVETCVATKVTSTGPATQMISCALASSENSGVSWRLLTTLG